MDLTEDQQAAIDACVKSIKSGSELTKLAGFAGTGKTTISREIAERSGIEPVYAAFTGKAASVLSQKTGTRAQTIHSLIMRYLGKSKDSVGKEELIFELDGGKAASLGNYLIVLDETSMIGQWLGKKIMSLGRPVLAIGDPFQLPPVKDRPYFGRPWNATLKEVIRHKGIILDLATDIRERGARVVEDQVYDGFYAAVRRRDFTEYHRYGQVLVGRNETRHVGNLKMRSVLGYTGSLVPGEKIVCLENNYWLGAFNGQQFTVLACQAGKGRGADRIWANLDCGCNPDSLDRICDICGWDMGREVPLWADEFTYVGDSVKRPGRNQGFRAMVATYGYVLTVNKAQGSEWESVLVIDESGRMGGNSARWLYTAVTRASRELAIIAY